MKKALLFLGAAIFGGLTVLTVQNRQAVGSTIKNAYNGTKNSFKSKPSATTTGNQAKFNKH